MISPGKPLAGERAMEDIISDGKRAAEQSDSLHWNDTGDKSADPAEMDEDYFDETQYSPFKRQSLGDTFSRLLLRFSSPLLIILAGIALLLLLTLLFFPGKGTMSSGSDPAGLEVRIAQLEGRLSRLESAVENPTQAQTQDSRYGRLEDRIDRLEASLSHRMDLLNRKVDEIIPPSGQNAARKTAPGRTSKALEMKDKPVPVQKKAAPAARYHTVQKGETLYRISRENGLTVEQLRALNHLHAGETIQPGQRLLLAP
jgi:LysM repeat protein